MIPFVFDWNFFFSFTTSIMYCLRVSMDKITALNNFSEKVLSYIMIMTSSSVLHLLIFDLILSLISGVVSLYSSSYSFSCSSPRLLTQLSVSLGESSKPRVLSLVLPMKSSLFLNGAGFFSPFYISYTIFFCLLLWLYVS